MNFTKIVVRGNIKFMVKFGWKIEEIIDVLRKVCKDIILKK